MKWGLKTYEGVLYGDYFWFSNNTFNGLFRMNIKTEKLEFIDFFPKIPMLAMGSHKKVFLYQDKLVFLPAFSNYIHIYDLINKKFETISFDQSDQMLATDRVGDAALINDKIYIFSWLKDESLIVFDLNKLSLHKSEVFNEEIGHIQDRIGHILTRCSISGADKICFALYGTDKIAEWNVVDNRLEIISTGVEDIFSVSILGDDRWIVTRTGKDIYKLNDSLKKYYCVDIERWNEKGRFYSGVKFINDEIVCVPAFSKNAVVYRDGKITKVDGDRWKLSYENVPAFFGTLILKDEIWFLPFSADDLYAYTFSTGRIRRIRFYLDDFSAKNSILKRVFDEKNDCGIVYEDPDYSLKDYICGL